MVSGSSVLPRFGLDGYTGDQDWLSLLGWHQPGLFYRLPCQVDTDTLGLAGIGTWNLSLK